MSDLISRLRNVRGSFIIDIEAPDVFGWADEAADEIERLRAELKQANAVVERVSKLPDEWMWKAQSENGPATVKMMSILAGQLEKALDAVEDDDG